MTSIRDRARIELGIAIIMAAILCGCASTPASRESDAKAPIELYDGLPATVHGAEYPVTSAVEGISRGDLAWQQGNLDLAIFLYVQVLQFEPDNAGVLRKIGAIHEGRGNRALARRAFEMALARGGEHAGTMERLALLLVADGMNEQAYALLTSVVALEPDRWRAHNALGVLADRRANYATAVAHYNDALAIRPNAGNVYNNRGYSKFLAGDLPGAERDLREAIALNAGKSAWLNLGRVQAKARQYGMAFKSFLETLDTAHAYNAVGEAAMRNEDHQIAKAYLESATNASPSYFEQAHKNLAVVNEELARRQGLP